MIDPFVFLIVLLAALQLFLVIVARLVARARRSTTAAPPSSERLPIEAWRRALRSPPKPEPAPEPSTPPPALTVAPPRRERRPHRVARATAAARRGMVWATILGPCRALNLDRDRAEQR